MSNFIEENPEIKYNSSKEYVYVKNGKIVSKKSVQRIKDLKIPLVYTTIWLSKDVFSDIQAIALDSKGRKQYFYSNKWISGRSVKKFERMYRFLYKLPILHEKMAKDMKGKKFKKRRTIAYMLRIVELTNIRIGNKKYLDQNDSFGLTTLKKEHIDIRKGKVVFVFKGKHKVSQELAINDLKVSNFIKKMNNLPTDWIMKYENKDGNWYRVSAQDVNNYIHDAIGSDFTCKDFRTHGANTTFLCALKECDVPVSENDKKRNISYALEKTANKLGNNKATSKKSYVMDYVIDEYRKNPKWVKDTFLLQILKKACK